MLTLLKRPNPVLVALDESIDRLSIKLQSMSDNFAAKFIASSRLLDISKEAYTIIADGLQSRLVTKETIKSGYEALYLDIINSLDFDAYSVIGIDFNVGEGLPLHFHEFDETVIVCEGKVEIDDNGSIIGKGSKIIVTRGTVHKFRPLTKGFAIALIHK